MGVKKNFKRGEGLEICIGIRGSAMNVIKEKRSWKSDLKSMRETTAKINLKLLNENRQLIDNITYESTFSDFHKGRLFFWKLNSSELEPGFYIIEVNYSDDYDASVDKNYNNRTLMLTTLRQIFRIR